MKGGYILFNGKFFRDKDLLFPGIDLFRIHSGIKETFRAEHNLALFAEDNYNYLINGLLSYGVPIPSEWNLSRFVHDVSRLLNKNHFFLAAKVTLYLIPGITGTDYLMMAEEISRGFYPLNENGLLIDFYEQGLKTPSVVDPYEPASRNIWLTASRKALEQSKDNLIILNHRGFACESIGGTFGFLKDGVAIFPSPKSHGYTPPLLGVVMECAEQSGFMVKEKNTICRDDLLKADELFLIDNVIGIQLVLGLSSRRYYMVGSTSMGIKLNEFTREEHHQK